VAAIAGDLVGLHATDPASVFLAAGARMAGPSVAAVEEALYEDESVVRMLGMRRTMFVVPPELAALVDAGCTREIAARERRRLIQALEAGGVAGDGASWLAEVEGEVLAALAATGEATGAELSAAAPRLRAELVVGEGRSWGGRVAVSSRVLFLLAADGRIVRRRPRGSWTSSQFRWAIPAAVRPKGIAPEAARAELARRWLARFGPALVDDLRWWTGWTAAQTRAALTAIPVAEVALDEGAGVALAEDLEPVAAPAPWAALLPALDPTAMGWTARDWYLGPHRDRLFDRSGNIGPTVWWDGRIVGGWAQAADGVIRLLLLEDVGAEAEAAVGAAAERTAELIGPARVTPRFRTPLERELAAG